jgi:hypothetical protein
MMLVMSEPTVGAGAWATYNKAFRNFSEKVRTIQHQAATRAAGPAEIEAAVLAVERARVAYSKARDAVAQQLLDSPRESVPRARLDLSPIHTAEVAQLLWECAGRPEGTAEADWYRAEEIIRAVRAEIYQV